MSANLIDPDVQSILELIGIFAFAVSGALMAIRKDFDAVGIVVLAEITALGGGIFRDLVIGSAPPAAFDNLAYFVVPLVASVVAFFGHRILERSMSAILLFDAAGLGMFTVLGTLKALDHGIAPLQAATLGVFTGVGGGLLRDVIARETPAVVRPDAELYAVPAIAGALVVAGAVEMDSYSPAVGIVAALFIFVFRILALINRWHAPRAWHAGTKGSGR